MTKLIIATLAAIFFGLINPLIGIIIFFTLLWWEDIEKKAI